MPKLKWLLDAVRQPTPWLVVPAFLSVLPMAEESFRTLWHAPRTDREQLFESHLGRLRGELGGIQSLGFLFEGGEAGDYFRAQYVLVPHVLREGTAHRPPLVVVYAEAASASVFGSALQGYVRQGDLGDGFYLYGRDSRQ